jgi:hypothetical protein
VVFHSVQCLDQIGRWKLLQPGKQECWSSSFQIFTTVLVWAHSAKNSMGYGGWGWLGRCMLRVNGFFHDFCKRTATSVHRFGWAHPVWIFSCHIPIPRRYMWHNIPPFLPTRHQLLKTDKWRMKTDGWRVTYLANQSNEFLGGQGTSGSVRPARRFCWADGCWADCNSPDASLGCNSRVAPGKL